MSIHEYDYGDGERYRGISEARILEFLICPFERAAGREREERAVVCSLLERLVKLGLPYAREQEGTRRFDLAEVVNFIKHAHFQHRDTTWSSRSVATMRRLCDPSFPDAAPAEPPELGGRQRSRWALTLTRRIAPPLGGGKGPLRLTMPRPLNAVAETVRTQWINTANADQPPREEPDRLTLKLPSTGDREILLKVRYEFEDGGPEMAADGACRAPERALYLEPREGLIVVSPEIRAIAAGLRLSAKDPERSLRRIWSYLFETFSFGFIHYDRLDPAEPLAWGLRTRRVDCRTGSATLVALCRAAGIPARLVAGYTLHPILPTSHTWAEALIDRVWTPFDTYALDLAGGDARSPWRDHYFGRLDERFVAERLPRRFAPAPRLGERWRLALAVTAEGATTRFERLETGELIYEEVVKVERLEP